MVQWLALSPYIQQVVIGFILGVMGGAICSPCAFRGCWGDRLGQTQSFFCSFYNLKTCSNFCPGQVLMYGPQYMKDFMSLKKI